MHVWKIYMAYSRYAVQLEIAGLEPGLRVHSRVFHLASTTRVPGMLILAVGSATKTIQVVAIYPVFILVAGILGFGRRCKIPLDVSVALVVLVMGWAVLYVAPDSIELIRLVDYAVASQ